MRIRRCILLLAAAWLFSGCAASAHTDTVPAGEPERTNALSPSPTVIVLAPVVIETIQQPSPVPTPEATATPEPTSVPELTATPEPTLEAELIETPLMSPLPEMEAPAEPTPNPYRTEKVTAYKKNKDFWYCKLNEAAQARIIGSTFPEDPKECPVRITDLRYVSVLYVDFEGEEHTGELIVHRKVADDVLDIFYHLYKARYPLTSVKLLDDFGEPFSDGTSMEKNNTSAFCCRLVTGTTHFSKHSYGIAIDINPALNPYIRPDGSFAPLNSEPYLDRSLGLPGMIDEKDYCYKQFKKHGWKWGGHFHGEKDYQHFYKKLK